MGMTLKSMDRTELRALYPTMRKDFPKNELKPLTKLEKQMRRGDCQGWFLMEEKTPRGYALVQNAPGCPYVLLDYLAVFSGQRGGGYGSQALQLLQRQYPDGILVEAEAQLPDVEETRENLTRCRRIAFYQKNGFVPCPFENSVFGVRYLIHLWTAQPLAHPEQAGAQALRAHYCHQLPEAIFRACVQISSPVS